MLCLNVELVPRYLDNQGIAGIQIKCSGRSLAWQMAIAFRTGLAGQKISDYSAHLQAEHIIIHIVASIRDNNEDS